MRWYWIDRFVEFESGRRAQAVKNISLAEDHIHDHYPAMPTMPKSLIIEGLAQTGGLLVYEHGGFTEKVILAKIPKVTFHFDVFPGETLLYTTTVDDFRRDGARVSATSTRDGELQAEAEIFFVHLNDRNVQSLFDAETFLNMMRILGAFDVGRAADGSPLRPPAHLVDAAGSI